MRRSLQLLFAIFWLVLVVLLYFWIHKPITPSLAKATGGAILDALSMVIIIAVSGGIGRRLTSPYISTLSHPERLAGDALLGMGILSVCILGVGLINLSFVSVVTILLVLAALTWRGLGSWLLDWQGWLRGIQFQTTWEKGLAWFIGLNLLMALVMAAAPPTRFDSITYHLLIPKLSLIDGQFRAHPENHFFGFPQVVNTLYTGQMALLFGRYTGGAILHWGIGSLALLATGGYASRRFSRFAGFLAPAILFTATSIWLQFSSAYIDLFTTACGMMVGIMLDEWRRAENDRKDQWLILAGVFAGLAAAAKYNSAMLGGVGVVYLLLFGWRRYGASIIRPILIYGVVIMVILLPWLIRNAVFYDNPLYPIVGSGGEWDELKTEFYQDVDNAPLKTNPLFIAPIFITPTILGIEGGGLFNSTIGPLFLLLIPLLLLTWKNVDEAWRISLGSLLLLVLLVHLVWLATSATVEVGVITRFVYPMFPWMAVLAAASLDSLKTLPRKPLDLAWIMRIMTALVFILTLIAHVTGKRSESDIVLEGTTLVDHFIASRASEYLVGYLDETGYLEHRLGWYPVAMAAVNDLPDDSKVLFLWETRTLYCDEPRITCEEDEILFNYWHDRRTVGDAEAILDDWHEQGITHVLVWETGRDYEFEDNAFFEESDFSEWERLTSQLDIHWQGEDIYTLYTLNDSIAE